MCGDPAVEDEALPHWLKMTQAARYYQVSPRLIRRLIAHEQLDARRIGDT